MLARLLPRLRRLRSRPGNGYRARPLRAAANRPFPPLPAAANRPFPARTSEGVTPSHEGSISFPSARVNSTCIRTIT